MKIRSILFFFLIWVTAIRGQQLALPFESNPNQTVTYEEMILYVRKLQRMFPEVRLDSIGVTDVGLPLHYLVIAENPKINREKAIQAGKAVVWINNGIHPGEPEGIDATLALLRDILQSREKKQMLKNLIIVVVPSYNIDGMLNRNAHSRANQNGPESYGFRGNARNLDLNRDFIKADSRNTQSYHKLYQQWLPHVFLDNHTSNGADYQHTMTLLQSLPDKLGSPLQEIMESALVPELYRKMEEAGWPMCPYVVTRGQDPAEGIYAYNDSPRYSSGYAALWGAIPLLSETHMLKPFIDRLQSNYSLMDILLQYCSKNAGTLLRLHEAWFTLQRSQSVYEYHWQITRESPDTIRFLGYEREMVPAKIGGQPIGKYNTSRPFERNIPFYKRSVPRKKTEIPEAFIIPFAWAEVIERLRLNGIEMEVLNESMTLPVKAWRVSDFKTLQFPYEGHYLHYDITLEEVERLQHFRPGDLLIRTNQPGLRYLMETLTPDAEDSFFAWNFFDAVLMAKEGYSDYVFDDLAAKILEENKGIKQALESKKAEDANFAQDGRAQLRFIYESSPYFDQNKNIIPVYRIMRP